MGGRVTLMTNIWRKSLFPLEISFSRGIFSGSMLGICGFFVRSLEGYTLSHDANLRRRRAISVEGASIEGPFRAAFKPCVWA